MAKSLNGMNYSVQHKSGLTADLPDAATVTPWELHFAKDADPITAFVSDGTDWHYIEFTKVV